ncbi:hypothetical protein FIBSPDRAFT_253699 [Athelia psychrophila]|uniref:Uncharacterized protein n=1 Tax=Athelia psychrophila TaxID=1759441 RepID=A0A165XQ18_9AGAM|nr:hypothetical protein FIBSPDRAFT_253699 [Fibularhizoctonia sp. CBS 109695]
MRDMPSASPEASPVLSRATHNANAHVMSKGGAPMEITTSARQPQVFPFTQSTSKSSSTSTSREARRVHLRMHVGPNPARRYGTRGREQLLRERTVERGEHGDDEHSEDLWERERGSCGTPVASTMNEATGGEGEGGLPAGEKVRVRSRAAGEEESAHVRRRSGGVQVGGDQHQSTPYMAGCEHQSMGAGVGGGVLGR